MKIDRDTWLSEAFGYSVFRVTVIEAGAKSPDDMASDLGLPDPERPVAEKIFYYAKVPAGRVEILHSLLPFGFKVVDVNVIYSRSPDESIGTFDASSVSVLDMIPDHHDAVLDIAESSFDYSRFHLDPEIPNETANSIKREWIANYVSKKRGEELLVALLDGKPAGFLAILATESQGRRCRVIDLVAVNRQSRGRGIGNALVRSFIQRYAGVCDLLRVGTQAANIPSVRLYERSGFLLEETIYVMHAHVGGD